MSEAPMYLWGLLGLALPHSGGQTILELTFWVCGINPSNSLREKARLHQADEPE